MFLRNISIQLGIEIIPFSRSKMSRTSDWTFRSETQSPVDQLDRHWKLFISFCLPLTKLHTTLLRSQMCQTVGLIYNFICIKCIAILRTYPNGSTWSDWRNSSLNTHLGSASQSILVPLSPFRSCLSNLNYLQVAKSICSLLILMDSVSESDFFCPCYQAWRVTVCV